jgi:hypothetical protein
MMLERRCLSTYARNDGSNTSFNNCHRLPRQKWHLNDFVAIQAFAGNVHLDSGRHGKGQKLWVLKEVRGHASEMDPETRRRMPECALASGSKNVLSGIQRCQSRGKVQLSCAMQKPQTVDLR